MPAILLWNIEHSSGYQDVFSSKNSFINEVIGACIKGFDVSVVILLEVTTQDSVDQFAYNHSLQYSVHGEGTSLKYAILTKGRHECTDVTAYFPSFADKPRGIAHVRIASGDIPPLLVTHIKSDQGMSGAVCLRDICQQLPENMHTSPEKWPRKGVIALADWNLKAGEARDVTRVFGGTIAAPNEPTRYPRIAANQIMQSAEEAKILDYACVFGTLQQNESLSASVPDVYYLRSILVLLDTYLKRVQEKVTSLSRSIAENELSVRKALAKNLSLVGLNAIFSQQEGLQKDKSNFDLAVEQISEFRTRIASRSRLDDQDRQVLHRLITQSGMGPDHLPVIVSW
ncbi:hypothetical protein BN2476_520001 [Paraburkholderia piptadeniae]|uniref:Uncharacterized protein n=1 Tax=Paraburkholderia piptadeniae TaxID=1701573 RepID=A0A1N7SHY0_9BURK|nr:hypothetical protein [Paraburkholderia piptadeniae]SIT46571.1 hypothetical protein BN2476_520001 [Paraburkholderia piptadeniae]